MSATYKWPDRYNVQIASGNVDAANVAHLNKIFTISVDRTKSNQKFEMGYKTILFRRIQWTSL